MTRRLLAASLLASVVGGIVVTATPAQATDTGHYICVGMPDKGKDPHSAYGVCIEYPKLVGP